MKVLSNFQSFLLTKKFLSLLLALILSLAILFIKQEFYQHITYSSPYLLLILPVVLSSWFGGLLSGLLATILCTILSYYLFFDSKYNILGIFTDVRSYLFFLEGVFISLLSEARLRLESEKSKLLRMEKEAREKAETGSEFYNFLSDASRILSSSLDYKTTLETVVKTMVPKFADWCILDVYEEGKFKRLQVLHKNPKKKKFADEIRIKYPPDITAVGGVGKVLRTGKPIFCPVVTPTVASATARNNPTLLNLLYSLGLNSFIIVPLIARNKTLGCLSLILEDQNKFYNQTHFSLAQALARRAALAVDNAILYKQAKLQVTKRKTAEEKLKRSLEQLEIILKNAADGITVQDKLGKIVYVNDVAAQLSGFKNANELLNNRTETIPRHYILSDERGRALSASDLPGGQVLSGKNFAESIVQSKNQISGEIKWSVIKASAVKDNKGKVMFAVNIISDITDRKNLELQRNTFISMVGHELKTPLTSIMAYTQLLQKKIKSTNYLEYINKIVDQTDKLNRLISDFTDVTKLRGHRLDFEDTNFDFDDLVAQVVEDMQNTTKTHQINIIGKTSSKINADKNRIYQVISNLLNNAIKYSPESSPINVQLSKTGKIINLSIEDFGIGIPKKSQETIFDSFSRLDYAKKSGIPGTGLGLYICSEIIKHYKGKIWVESEVNKGSKFHINLPILRS